MTAASERTSRDYSHEAEATRQRISRSVDELTDRLTVGQVLDEVLGYAKGGGGTMATALTRAARDNPIPSLLVSAGCMMFLSERLGFPGRSTRMQMPGSNSMARKPGASLNQSVNDVTQFAEDGLSSAGEQLGNIGRQVRDGASKAARAAGDTVRDYSAGVADEVSDLAGQAQEQLETASQQLIEQARRLIDEQPLLAGAIGLAIGAGLAAVIPKTETEQEYMGEASQTVKEAATEFAEQQYENAKDVVGRVSEAAMNAADQEGLTGSAVKDFAGTAAEKVNKVVKAAKDEATSDNPRR
jgi:ElaB/YqjD/DUF883 family membrane-anchored ribosome-binding protein